MEKRDIDQLTKALEAGKVVGSELNPDEKIKVESLEFFLEKTIITTEDIVFWKRFHRAHRIPRKLKKRVEKKEYKEFLKNYNDRKFQLECEKYERETKRRKEDSKTLPIVE